MRLIAPANATSWAMHGQDILQDLRRLARGNYNGIVVGMSDSSSWRLEELELMIDEGNEVEAQEMFVDILESMHNNEKSIHMHIRLQILHSKIRNGYNLTLERNFEEVI